ncbi:hypothetical protein F3Y22_tig00116997pilonHSYRG00305 [Hibiscus syriacus]|uniref:Phosphoinositide-specific phospholipase C EF-hand-like domain-containing protein n=1 Tax=Hibiscus syriacus TaxID=106335 RepID=A0A6A2X478_HIBSY|nr:hypothetical protein F3Y22_tig00116997pilonHSYRG00305 [Hibiscus syriacus]
MGTYRMCGCFTRKFKVIEEAPPPDVKAAFDKYAEGGDQMTAKQLRKFLVEVQGQNCATVADAEEIALQVLQKRHHMARFRRHALTNDDFYQYLFSADLNPPIDTKVRVYMEDGWNLDFKKTHFDTFSPPDFYTRVGIAGVPAAERTKKTKTKDDD